MKLLRSQITINGYYFDFVNEVEVNSSWDMVTDTAKIIIPKKLTFEGKPIVAGLNSLFKRGDPVEINLGYGETLHNVFSGYISAIKPKLPIEITCDDQMYLLKKKLVNPKAYKSITLKDLLTELVGTTLPFETNFNMLMENFRIGSNLTVAQVLEEIRKTYGVVSFVREGKLYVGFAYLEKLRKEHKFENVVSTDDLEYRRLDDIKLKVKATSITTGDKKKKRIEVELGDPDGETRTLHYYNKTEEQLRQIAGQELIKLRYEGYFGSFEAFGEPFARHSDVAIVIDQKVPEREGKYLIKSVNYTFGQSGYRQKIQLDRKISGQL